MTCTLHIGASARAVAAFGPSSSDVRPLLQVTTESGYRVALNPESLFHLARSPDGHPVIGNAAARLLQIDQHANSDAFRRGLVLGLVYARGRFVRRSNVTAHIQVHKAASDILPVVREVLDGLREDVRRADGARYPILEESEQHNAAILLASRLINILVEPYLDERGHVLDIAAIEAAPVAFRTGLLVGTLVASPFGHPLTFRSSLSAQWLHAELMAMFGARAELHLPNWKGDVHTANNGRNDMPRLTVPPEALQRLRGLSPLLAGWLPDPDCDPDTAMFADPIVKVVRTEQPAVAVDLQARGHVGHAGFNFLHVERDPAETARALEFAHTIEGIAQ